ncbi:hypothetical protein DI396_15950 [Litorivita pollutaquae]|uniref:Flagellin C-terminal domain-containing protein n=1 Tax=Litorivita pollutaquae TaxID=2200892 RepID=A0A2V4MXG5_9RHOB|nr:flagellin [Litorivita pollutaquae]OUS23129.1 hypothetical protein A9Q95_00065 [Rhodobacterales bacterium 59_46_T64]PYC46342.1 hypothetical protein DI396_15950 [Litorivita pollutaquae]
MSQMTIGDMAAHFMLRRQNVDIKQNLTQLTEELASGRTADVSEHLGGNYSYLNEIERGMTLLKGYETATGEAGIFTGAMQASLETVQEQTSDLAADLVMVSSSSIPSVLTSASGDARTQLQSIVSALNTNVAGRALFSGVEVDKSPLISGDEILDELRSALTMAGAVTVGDIDTVLDDYFDTPGGGFETSAYQGATTSMSPFLLGEGESVNLDLRADAQGFRDLLKSTAKAALASDTTLGYPSTTQLDLLRMSGEELLTAQSGLTAIRSDLGYAEARIEESKVRVASEKSSLEYARGELIGIDPYETATKLENAQHQLETLYTLTVRMSRLSLMDYM